MRKKFLPLFFLLLITSQLHGLIFAPKITLGEKRRPASLPEYKTERLLENKYYFELAQFLNEHYSYRSIFIIAKNWVDYYILNTSPLPKVHIGKDGWLYLKNGLYSYLKNDCNKEKKALKLARSLNSIEKIFESAGKKFFFVVAPDKATIYPEHVGFKRPQNSCGMNFYELFLQALEKYPLHGFIRLDNSLIDAKKDFPLYFATGTHWNHRGSILASRVMLEKLSTSTKKFILPDIKFMENERTRDLAALFSLNLKEKSNYAIRIHKNVAIKIRSLKDLPNGKSHLQITTTARTDKSLLPHTIIYRDSFMFMPLKMMQGSFKEIDAFSAHRLPISNKIDTDSLRASKIVMIEVVERILDKVRINKKELLLALGGSPAPQ